MNERKPCSRERRKKNWCQEPRDQNKLARARCVHAQKPKPRTHGVVKSSADGM